MKRKRYSEEQIISILKEHRKRPRISVCSIPRVRPTLTPVTDDRSL